MVLALLGTAGADDVDDRIDNVDDRADACPPQLWAASFYGSSADAALVLVQAKADNAENAATPRPRPATPALRLL